MEITVRIDYDSIINAVRRDLWSTAITEEQLQQVATSMLTEITKQTNIRIIAG